MNKNPPKLTPPLPLRTLEAENANSRMVVRQPAFELIKLKVEETGNHCLFCVRDSIKEAMVAGFCLRPILVFFWFPCDGANSLT